ncbi:WXG100 family type VII secretion target [Streptacidiphilus cavernicola]|uniref:WXG100 family type VII secretion target n=1 Tax=Streptacidiphilus cavernicola TaxID=3342716 RepID=A0ABV6W0S9_9ACTN
MSAATGGGGGAPQPGTGSGADFAGDGAGGLVGLRAMIADADPGSLDTVSARWTAIQQALVAAQADLRTHTGAALQHWEGAAADGFASRASQLAEALGNGAEYASNAGTGVSAAAEALRLAKQTMPKVPSQWDRFTRALTSERNGQAFDQDLSAGMTREQAIKQDGGQLSLMEERHQQAVAVMERLESSYNAAAQMIGEPPGDAFGGHDVYPSPPPTIRRSSVTSKSASTVADPGAGGGARQVEGGGTAESRSKQVLDPARSGSVEMGGDSRSGYGISGGEHPPRLPDLGTTVQGTTPEVSGVAETAELRDGGTTGADAVRETGGRAGIEGISGGNAGIWDSAPISSGATRGHSRNEGEGWYTVSDNPSSERGRPIGAGGSGRQESEEGFIEELSGTKGGGVAGETVKQGGPAMIGGLGLGTGSKGKKCKRRARARYLVEDEEAWIADGHANPPVIS